MAEALMLNANGGAVGVWASSALTVAPQQMEVARTHRRIFGARIGERCAMRKRAEDMGRAALVDPVRRPVDEVEVRINSPLSPTRSVGERAGGRARAQRRPSP
jgi:hypothetical protein